MKGTYGKVQKLIKDVEPSVLYVDCAAHNLNLVNLDVIEMQTFFETVNNFIILNV